MSNQRFSWGRIHLAHTQSSYGDLHTLRCLEKQPPPFEHSLHISQADFDKIAKQEIWGDFRDHNYISFGLKALKNTIVCTLIINICPNRNMHIHGVNNLKEGHTFTAFSADWLGEIQQNSRNLHFSQVDFFVIQILLKSFKRNVKITYYLKSYQIEKVYISSSLVLLNRRLQCVI